MDMLSAANFEVSRRDLRCGVQPHGPVPLNFSMDVEFEI
jgi:hypothetical protein